MNRALAVLMALVLASPLCAIDTSGMVPVGRSVHFTVFARDDQDYTGLLASLEDAYVRIVGELNPGFCRTVTVYVYPDQRAFVKAVFGWSRVEMNVTGLADHVRSILYVTSIHDDCRPRDYMRRMPVHELTHLIFPSQVTWIREGVADYEAGIVRDVDADELPTALRDLRFSGSDQDRERAYGQAASLVEYIVERILGGDRRRLSKYLSNRVNSEGRIVPDEASVITGWKQYLRETKAQARPRGAQS